MITDAHGSSYESKIVAAKNVLEAKAVMRERMASTQKRPKRPKSVPVDVPWMPPKVSLKFANPNVVSEQSAAGPVGMATLVSHLFDSENDNRRDF